MDGDLVQLAIWVFILAAVGFFTWVRKLIEKAQKGEPGDRKSVGGAVRSQIEKYMKALEESPMGRGIAAPPRTEPKPRPEEPAPSASEWAPARPARPEPVPTVKPARPVAPVRSKNLTATAAALVSRTGGRGFRRNLDRRKVRDAVILGELLGPPMAERTDYRLF